MEAVPIWWLRVSAVFFALGGIAYVLTAFLMWKLRRAVAELTPKVDDLIVTVTETGKSLKAAVSDVQQTTHVVREKSERVLGSGGVVDVVADRLGMVSTVLGVVISLAKARNELAKMRASDDKPAKKK
jgi:hypothetical protein